MLASRGPVIAKIEKQQTVDQLPAIIDAFDAIMVVRVDHGAELPLEELPIVHATIDFFRRQEHRIMTR